MAKILPSDYRPSNPPIKFASWHRWIVEELNRIARRLIDNPVILALGQTGAPVDISPVLNSIVLGIGSIPSPEFPEGSYDPLTGVWTCPLNGIYSMTSTVAVDPFGTGNKAWEAVIVIYRNGVRAFEAGGSGIDDVRLFINMGVPLIFTAGDTIRLELETIHDQFTGSTTYDYRMGLTRLSAAL